MDQRNWRNGSPGYDFRWHKWTIPAAFTAQGHLCTGGAPGLLLVCLLSLLTDQWQWFGSAVKVLTRRGIDEESTAAATTGLYLPLIPAMTHPSDLTVAAEWLARGVSRVTARTADGRVVPVIDTFQPSPANADGSPACYDRTQPFPRSHSNECGSPGSDCPVAVRVSRAELEQLSAGAGVHVVLQPTRQPEVEATGESQGRRYAALQPCVDYEVQLCGSDSAEWAVGQVMLLWSAAGSVRESDKRRLKRMRL